MRRVVLDPATVAKFGDLCEPVELCDESGRVLGRILPESIQAESNGPHSPDFTEEEICALREQTGGRSLAEIRRSLEKTA
jgi:hypothetical protein